MVTLNDVLPFFLFSVMWRDILSQTKGLDCDVNGPCAPSTFAQKWKRELAKASVRFDAPTLSDRPSLASQAELNLRRTSPTAPWIQIRVRP